MSLSRDSRQERKLKAVLRAKFALKQRFERIDHEEDVVNVVVNDFKAGKSVLGLPAGAAFDMDIIDETEVVSETASDAKAGA